MKVLAIIPARGGSTGLPRKNIRELAGKPLIAWVIKAAGTSNEITRTIVSTDSTQIASIAKECGAEVPFLRPSELAQNLSTTHVVVEHALNWLVEHDAYHPDIVVLLPPTAPLVLPEDLDEGVRTLLRDKEADSVRPVIESPKHPYKTFVVKSGHLAPFLSTEVTGHEEPYDMPRQLFPTAYVYSGTFQVFRPKVILEQGSLSGRVMGYMNMPSSRSINIDSLDDFEYADMLMRRRVSKQSSTSTGVKSDEKQ